MVSSTCNSNTEESKNCQELKAQPGLHSEHQASLGYIMNTRPVWTDVQNELPKEQTKHKLRL